MRPATSFFFIQLSNSREAMTIEDHMSHYEKQGIDRKEAMKLVAKDRGVSKRDIYQALL